MKTNFSTLASLVVTALFLCGATVEAQTSKACTAAGYCGNSTTGSTYDFSTNHPWGIPFTINASYTVTSLQIVTGTGTGNISATILCDTNVSGSTLTHACTGGQVFCYAAVAFSASTTMTINFTGCNLTNTAYRYWALVNTDAGGNQRITTTGSPTGQWYGISTYGDAACTTTGPGTDCIDTVYDGGEAISIGINLASAAAARHRVIVVTH